jgi:hypothetical protein
MILAARRLNFWCALFAIQEDSVFLILSYFVSMPSAFDQRRISLRSTLRFLHTRRAVLVLGINRHAGSAGQHNLNAIPKQIAGDLQGKIP